MQNILKCKKLKTVFVQYTVHKIALINIIYFTVKFVVIRGRGRVQYGALRSGGKSGRRGWVGMYLIERNSCSSAYSQSAATVGKESSV